MNTQEVSLLLARIQVLDNRQVDELTIQAWEELLHDVTYEDAVAAVNDHFRTSPEYLKPFHIVRQARVFAQRRRQVMANTPHQPVWAKTPTGDSYCEVCGDHESDHGWRITQRRLRAVPKTKVGGAA